MSDCMRIDRIKYDFMEAIIEIDSLKEFLTIHSRTNKSNLDKFLNDYDIGLKIASLFDKVMALSSIEEKTEYINSIQEEFIGANLKLKDILAITYDCEEDCVSFQMSPRYDSKQYNPQVAKDKQISLKKQDKIFAQSILSNAIIIFESYLAKVYEILALKFPDKYFENKQIPLCGILSGDLGNIISKSIKSEIEQNMYDTLKTLDKMKEKSGFDVERHFKIRKKFEEIYYRRNIYVHNNGKANEIYLSKVDMNYRKKVTMNQYLFCDEEYLLDSILITKKMICAMFYELLVAEDADNDIFETLADVGYDALCVEEYKNAEQIYCMLSKTKKFPYKLKAMYQVNYINSLKQQGKNINNLLDSFDVSIATDDFIIAKLCLQDEHTKVFEMIERTYPEPFPAQVIREWPLFIDFRKTEYYEILEVNHPDDFKKFVFEEKNSCVENITSTVMETEKLEVAF